MTIGWKLSGECRAALLAAHPPRYGNIVADHVTLSVAGTKPPPPVADAIIIGHTDDDCGVEALVGAINGSTTRCDGGVWHITWSLAPGRAARESNDIIANLGWRSVPNKQLTLFAAHW